MTECIYCNCEKLVKATIKASKKEVVVCRECDSVYEIDENGSIILEADNAKELCELFKYWDELENISPYVG